MHLIHFSPPYFTHLTVGTLWQSMLKASLKDKVNSKHCSSSSVEPVFLSKVCPLQRHIAPSVLSHLHVPQVLGNVFQQYLLQTHPGDGGEADRSAAPWLSPPVPLEAAAAQSATFLLKRCGKSSDVFKCSVSSVSECLCVSVRKKKKQSFWKPD